jgi:protein disulfide-isomerase
MFRSLLAALACVLALGAAGTVAGADLPYDEKADAHADLQRALAQAKKENKQVLAVFGANWCKDCRELDKALHGKTAGLVDGKFVVVKIDVGNFDRNTDIANAYGNPIRKGIPAAVLLTADNKVLYATRGGELADARSMGETGIYDFFNAMLTKNR